MMMTSRRLSSAEFCFENKKTTRIACFAVSIDSKGGRRKKKFLLCVCVDVSNQ